MKELERTLNGLINCSVEAELFDCSDVAEIRIKLVTYVFPIYGLPIYFIAFTNVVVPEDQTAQDVFQAYKGKGYFDVEKFINDHGPLQFVARERFQDDVDELRYKYEHLHLNNQEDFCSPFSESENRLIQSKLLETYQRILFLADMGFSPELVASYMGEENDMADHIDASVILTPLLTAKQLTEKPQADQFTVKLGKSPDEVFVQFTLKAHDAETYLHYHDHFSVDAGILYKVDHLNSKLTVKEVSYVTMNFEQFNSDFETHMPRGFAEWFVELIEQCNLNNIAQDLCSKKTLESKLHEIVTSDLTTATIESHIFIAN